MFNSSIYALQLHMNIDMNKPVLLSEASRNDKVPRSTKYQSSLFSKGTVIYICTELLCIIQSPLWANQNTEFWSTNQYGGEWLQNLIPGQLKCVI